MPSSIIAKTEPVLAGEVVSSKSTPDYWVSLIQTEWQKSIEGVLNVARHLVEAKEAVEHGRWGEVVENLPFGESAARRLMAIGADDWILNQAHGPVLPNSWRTLYELTKLPDEDKDQMLADGIISPDMQRKDVTLQARAISGRNIGQPAPLPDNKYEVIYADPPWRYEFSKSDSREIENQYPTMELDDICALPISNLAADNSVLYMWTTSPKLEESFKVLNAWGFEYKTCAVWDKKKIGMGYYFRQQHELILIATKGSLPAPEPSTRVSSVIEFPRGKHSAKPLEVIELLNTMYPARSKIELFCRDPQEGWTAWGNQSGS